MRNLKNVNTCLLFLNIFENPDIFELINVKYHIYRSSWQMSIRKVFVKLTYYQYFLDSKSGLFKRGYILLNAGSTIIKKSNIEYFYIHLLSAKKKISNSFQKICYC